MTISIITPSYQQAAWLPETIHSVLDQNGDLYEYHLLDGGSTDGSLEIIKSHADRFTSWVSQRDNGQADAINKGVSKSNGDILGWVNSDDILLPGALSHVRKQFEQNPGLELLCGMALVIDEESNVVSVKRKGIRSKLMASTGIINLMQPACFFTRNLWDRVDGLDEQLNWMLDTDLFYKMFKEARNIRRTGEYLACCRLQKDQKTQQTENSAFMQERELMRKRYPQMFHLNLQQKLARFWFRQTDLIESVTQKKHERLVKGMNVYHAASKLCSAA